MVRVSHREAWLVEKARVHRHEPRWRIRLHVGHRSPGKVSCIYADNPGGNRDMLARRGDLAANDVPLLHVCGSIDPLLGKYSSVIEGIYQQLGGRISVMIKDGAAHHPHSLRNPKPIADFITQSVQPTNSVAPDYLGNKVTRSSFYSLANDYRDFPGEGTNITCRGPLFAECYDATRSIGGR